LVGPVGAATNGIELLRDLSSNQNADILDMTDDSARTAWRRLEFFRVAFGYGGGRDGWSEPELISLASGVLNDTRVSLDWPASEAGLIIIGRGGKLVLNLIFLIAEAMPRGGQVRVALTQQDDKLQVQIAGHGSGATLNPRVESTVTGKAPLDELDSRVILAHLSHLQSLSAEAEAEVEWVLSQDCVLANVLLPQPVLVEADA
jgi:histidine phosphotransferase ChpT